MIIVASHGWNALWLAFFYATIRLCLCDYSYLSMRLFAMAISTTRMSQRGYSHFFM